MLVVIIVWKVEWSHVICIHVTSHATSLRIEHLFYFLGLGRNASSSMHFNNTVDSQ